MQLNRVGCSSRNSKIERCCHPESPNESDRIFRECRLRNHVNAFRDEVVAAIGDIDDISIGEVSGQCVDGKIPFMQIFLNGLAGQFWNIENMRWCDHSVKLKLGLTKNNEAASGAWSQSLCKIFWVNCHSKIIIYWHSAEQKISDWPPDDEDRIGMYIEWGAKG